MYQNPNLQNDGIQALELKECQFTNETVVQAKRDPKYGALKPRGMISNKPPSSQSSRTKVPSSQPAKNSTGSFDPGFKYLSGVSNGYVPNIAPDPLKDYMKLEAQSYLHPG